MPSLFDPITVGALRLPNRIVMAPLTRARATIDTRVGSITRFCMLVVS